MFRDLIPLLADRFHIVAPDLPGFGQSDMPARETFAYTFDNIAAIIDRFTEVVGLERFAIYVFDYGAPTGLPHRAEAPRAHHRDHLAERQCLRGGPERRLEPDPGVLERSVGGQSRRAARILTPETTLWQYTHGVADVSAVSPDGYSLDDFYLARPGADEIQLDLFGDYKSNVALYPKFQDYFRTHKPPFLAVWGKNDPFFLPAGAEAFKRDIPSATVLLRYRPLRARNACR